MSRLAFLLDFFNMYFLSCSWHGFTNFQKSSCNSNSFFFFFFFQNFRMKSSIPRLPFFLLDFEHFSPILNSEMTFNIVLIFFSTSFKLSMSMIAPFFHNFSDIFYIFGAVHDMMSPTPNSKKFKDIYIRTNKTILSKRYKTSGKK